MTAFRALETLLSLGGQSALLIAGTSALQRRVKSDRAREALWGGCCLGLLLLIVLGVTVPHLRLLRMPQSGSAIVLAWQQGIADVAAALVVLWVAGAVVSIGRLIHGIWIASRVVARSRPLDARQQRLAGPAIELCRQRGFTGKFREDAVNYRVSDKVAGPFCWQFHQPFVVMPRGLLEFPLEELAAILRHELTHLRERHAIQLFLQRIVACLLWFLPWVQTGHRQAMQHREFICDRAAAGDRDQTIAYLRSLLRLARLQAEVGDHGLCLPLIDSETRIEDRIQNLRLPAVRVGSSTLLLMKWTPLVVAAALGMAFWLPVDPSASERSIWSPWPAVSSRALQLFGIPARDYEVDGYRLLPQEHRHAPKGREDSASGRAGKSRSS